MITDWLARIKELNSIIEPLERERAELKCKVLSSKSKFKIGDVIEWNEGSCRGRVLEIREWMCGDPMWKVQRILKDGSNGQCCVVRPYQNPVLAPPQPRA